MKLYLLKPVIPDDKWGQLAGERWVPWYDTAAGFVVRAESKAEARQMAQDRHGEEYSTYYPSHPTETWLDHEQTFCAELTEAGPAEIILRDFRAA